MKLPDTAGNGICFFQQGICLTVRAAYSLCFQIALKFHHSDVTIRLVVQDDLLALRCLQGVWVISPLFKLDDRLCITLEDAVVNSVLDREGQVFTPQAHRSAGTVSKRLQHRIVRVRLSPAKGEFLFLQFAADLTGLQRIEVFIGF